MGVSEDEITQLDDNDMMKIARKMEDYYVTGEFWGDLEFAARKILARHGAHILVRSHEAIELDPGENLLPDELKK